MDARSDLTERLLAATAPAHTATQSEMETLAEADEKTRGIGEYVGTVRSDDAVETAILGVGSGLAVSTKVARD